MKDILNARVKFREPFRPFAPVIPEENISEVFDKNVASPFMLLVSPIKPEYHQEIPGVTHFDGTGRVHLTDSMIDRTLRAVPRSFAASMDGCWYSV